MILKQISVLKLKTDKNSGLHQLEISSLQYSIWLKFFLPNLSNILTDKVKSQVTTELWSEHLNSAQCDRRYCQIGSGVRRTRLAQENLQQMYRVTQISHTLSLGALPPGAASPSLGMTYEDQNSRYQDSGRDSTSLALASSGGRHRWLWSAAVTNVRLFTWRQITDTS